MATMVKTDIAALRQEVKQLRSFVIGIAGADPEGDYRPEFVRKILRAAREKSLHEFKGKHAFLSQLRRGKHS